MTKTSQKSVFLGREGHLLARLDIKMVYINSTGFKNIAF
jgi:hypothetical protein